MTMKQIKIKLLHEMDNFIRNIGDEDILETWLMCGLPDGADEEDYIFFAENEENWTEICSLFGKLAKRMGEKAYTGRVG